MNMTKGGLPTLLVLASTYPRWSGDHEPGFVHELSRRLTDRFRVIALVPGAPGARDREILDGVEVHRYRYAPRAWETLVNDGGIVTNLRRSPWKVLLVPGFVLAQAWYAWRLTRKSTIDVIHAHWLLPQGIIAWFLAGAWGNQRPYVVTSHGADLYALRGKAMDALKRMVLRRAACVTVVSRAMRDSIGRLESNIGEVQVMPMGVDLAERFTRDESTARSQNGVLFVGRLVEKKGLRFLIEAIPHVLKRVPDASLTVVGFGPEEEAIRKQVEELGISGRVCFVGAASQQELPSFYRRAKVLVAPFVQANSGDQEGLGLVVVEAMGCGCPVITSDLPALREVGTCFSGFVKLPPGDPLKLADALIHMLQTDAQLDFPDISKFDWNAVASGYRKVLDAARRSRTTSKTDLPT